jgi:hypothetical protein
VNGIDKALAKLAYKETVGGDADIVTYDPKEFPDAMDEFPFRAETFVTTPNKAKAALGWAPKHTVEEGTFAYSLLAIVRSFFITAYMFPILLPSNQSITIPVITFHPSAHLFILKTSQWRSLTTRRWAGWTRISLQRETLLLLKQRRPLCKHMWQRYSYPRHMSCPGT